MAFETITLDPVQDGTVVLTLNRPAALNSISPQMIDDLRTAIARVAADDETRVLLVTGAGRAFCAGADLASGGARDAAMSVGEGVAHSIEVGFNPLVRELASLAKPVVAAVNGVAAGGGVGLAMCADIVVAARSAHFIQVFGPQLGIVPDMGCTYFLTRLLGRARARGLALLGDRLPAEQAEAWGMIWKCVDDDALMPEALSVAARLAKGPGLGFAHIKQALDEAELNSLSHQLEVERKAQRVLADTEDFMEGVRAFLERRAPAFKGR